MRKKAIPVQLDEKEREILEALAAKWGVSMSASVCRLLREYGDPIVKSH